MKFPFHPFTNKAMQDRTIKTINSKRVKLIRPTLVQKITWRLARFFQRKRRRTEPSPPRIQTVPQCSTPSNLTSSTSVLSRICDKSTHATDYQVLEDCYTLKATIGEGSFGKVKKATHKLTGEYVAIKIIKKAMLGKELNRVRREINALKLLDHPFISKLYQIMETEKHLFIIMEYCQGGDLYGLIRRKKALKEGKAQKFFRQLVSAVQYAHENGISHRDLKPENVLLDEKGDVKLIDFNLSAVITKGYLDTHCGTIEYAPPELIRGDAYDGKKSDAWSLGVVLYVLLCGRFPFEEPGMREKIKMAFYFKPKSLSIASGNLIDKLLRVDPDERLSLKDLLKEHWLNPTGLRQKCSKISCSTMSFEVKDSRKVLDLHILSMMSSRLNIPIDELSTTVSKFRFDSNFNNDLATYLILGRKKQSIGPSDFVTWISRWNPRESKRSILTQINGGLTS